MSDFQTLLNQFSGGGGVLEEKQKSVAQAAMQKQVRLGGAPSQADYTNAVVGGQNNVGAASASPWESELRTLTPFQLAMKYGETAATQMNNDSVNAASDIQRKLSVERTPTRAIGDTVTEILSGATNSVVGLGNVGLGLIDTAANTLNGGINAGLSAFGSSYKLPTSSSMGVNSAQAMSNINKAVAGTESDTLQNRNEILALKNALTARDNTQVLDQEISAGRNSTMAGLKRIGNDTLDSLGNASSDPITLLSGTAQGVGSLLAAGPIAKGITLSGATAGRATGMLSEAAARTAAAGVAEGAVPLSIGAMEAGGAYQQTATAAMEKLAGRADLSQEQKQQLANDTALKAAALTAPAAILAGKLVAPFEASPLSKVGLKTAAGNIIKEPIEEGLQGGTGQFAQNLATKQNIDPKQSLTDGVGEQVGTGALYGLTTAGALQTPAVARGSVEASIKAVGSVMGGVTNFLIDRGDKVLNKLEADSPASINRAVEQAASLIQDAPAISAKLEQTLAPAATDTPEVAAAKATALADFPGFIAALQINDSERQSYIMKPVADVIASVQTRPEAVAAIIEDLKKEKDPQTRFAKTVALQVLVNTAFDSTDKLGEVDDSLLPEDASKLFQSLNAMGNLLGESPEVLRELQNAGKFLETDLGKKLLNDMNQTPESAQGIAAASQMSPEKINPEVAKTVLKMAQNKQVVLSGTQVAALQMAIALVESAETYDSALMSQSVTPKNKDIVSFQIKTEDDSGLDKQGSRSALQHARYIGSLVGKGDMKEAKQALAALGFFAQGQNNKVIGINDHFEAGKGAPYSKVMVASADGKKMIESKVQTGVTPTKEGSVAAVKTIAAEARFLADLHNKLNEAYNLGEEALPIVELNAALKGKTADVVKGFIDGSRTYPNAKSAAVVPLVPATPAAPVVKAKKESKPKAVKEPKPFKISVAVKNQSTKKLEERLTTETRPNILEQVKAELEIRKNTPTPETPNVIETPEAIQAKPSQTPQEASAPAATGTPVTPSAKVEITDAVVSEAQKGFAQIGLEPHVFADGWNDDNFYVGYNKKDNSWVVEDQRDETTKNNGGKFQYHTVNTWQEAAQLIKDLRDGIKATGTASVTTVKKPDSKSTYAEKIIATLLAKEKVLDAIDSGIDPNVVSAAEYTAEVEFKQALQKVVKASGEFINRVQRFGTNYALRLQDKQDALSAELKDSEGVTDTDTAISLLRDVVAYMAEHEAKQGQLFEEGPPITSVVEPIATNVYFGTGESASLSNLASRPFNLATGVDGEVFDPNDVEFNLRVNNFLSVEHAYQSLKSGKFDEATYAKYTKAGQKIVGNKGTNTADSIALMEVLIRASFAQNPEAKKTLLATGDTVITHTQDKGIWGKEFPRILMELREIYKANQAPAQSQQALVATETVVRVEPAVPPVAEAPVTPKAEPVTPTDTVAKVVPPEAAKTVREAYPALLNQGETSFGAAFNLRNTPSRFFGSASPIQALETALSSTKEMIAFVGSTTTKHMLTPLAQNFYRETLPTIAREIAGVAAVRLNASLRGIEGKSPLRDLFTNPTKSKKGELNIPQDMTRGRVFNITEMNAKGDPVYNQNLLESAILGSLSWFMTSGNDGPKYEAAEVAAAMGMPADDVGQALVDQFNSGAQLIKLDVIGRMATHITEFWGVKPNNDFSQTATVGIPQAVATEILRAMQKAGLVTSVPIQTVEGRYSIESFVLNHDKLGKDYTSYPSFLGEMANSETLEAMYFGKDRPPVRTTQMGSAFVDLTEDQQQMLRNEQDVVHRVNMPVIAMYKALNKDRLLDLFGTAYLDNDSKDLYNAEHLKSVEGKNLSIVAAYDSLMGRVDAVTSAAEAEGIEAGDLNIHMPYEISKNGRMFMRGAYNEQASKVTREGIMPTRATLDLSNETVLSDYMASLAQMLGVRVHELTREGAVEKVMTLLNTDLLEAVGVMREFLNTEAFTDEAVATLKELLPLAKGTNMALHALLEYATYLEYKAANSPMNKYVTNIYMEADGVGNGPMNAMLLFGTGPFTPANLTNMAKGGMFFAPGMTMNTHRGDETNPNRDPIDLYKDGAFNLKDELAVLKKDLTTKSADKNPTEYFNSLFRLLNEFLGDVSFDDNGNIQVERGTIKNPMMITIYGSGVNGIAGNILDELMEAIYARMSGAMQAQNVRAADGETLTIADAMFADAAKSSPLRSTEKLYAQFAADFGNLTKEKVVFNKVEDRYQVWSHKTDSGVYAQGVSLPLANSTDYAEALKSFKLKGAEWGALRENMATLFVKPMRVAVDISLGSDVLEASKLVQKATNVQSLAMQFAFKEAVTEAMAKSGRRGGMYISKNEQAKVIKELLRKFPMVTNAQQQFLIAKSSQSTVSAAAFSQSLTGDLEMMAVVNAPSAAGVAGGPLVIIGYGDSLMMQEHSLMDGAIKNVLRIFDGMHMPVDKIMEGSRQINEAVHKTWQNNPLRDVATSFRKARPAIENAAFTDALSPDDLAAFNKALGLKPNSKMTAGEALDSIQADLDDAANQHEARIVAMSQFAQSVDQMAAAGASYQYAGRDISMLTLEDQADILETERRKALVKIRARHKAQAANSEELKAGTKGLKINTVLTEFAQQEPTTSYTAQGLRLEISEMLKNSGNADLIPVALVALSSVDMKDTVIKIVSLDSLGVDEEGNNINGSYDPNTNTVSIASPDAEVWVHELVHAATFKKIENVLADKNESLETVAAVLRLQELMKQFEEMGESVERTAEQNLAYRIALNSMNATVGEAARLNEFMTWATTNAQLIALGKVTEAVPSKWVAITKKVMLLIRRIFLGSSSATIPTDFFNAVRFNTAIVAMDKQPSVTKEAQGLILRHTTAYGNDARLNQIQKTYIDLVEPLFADVANLNQKLATGVYAANLVNAVQAAFPMNQQEKSTFLTVVSALATEAKVNPASVAMSQSLYNHVTKQLTVEDFMDNPELQDPVDRYYAQAKYDMILGKSVNMADAAGRSSLMPVFLALATTDEGFRNILSKMDMPKDAKKTGTTLDVYLRNYGTQAMEALANTLAGVSANDSVKQAIDGLQSNIVAITAEKATLLDLTINKFGSWIDGANDYVVGTLGSVSVKGAALGSKMDKSNNKYVVKSAGVVKVLAGLLSDKRTGELAEGFLAGINTLEKYQPLRDLVNDIIGRTTSNATVYDMIKQVRATVASIRQEFRENVPLKLAKEFKTELSDESWTDLTHAVAMTDMVAVDLPFTEIVELVRNKAKMAQAIKAKEGQIKAVTGKASAVYLAKTLQLSNYMKTGKTGQNLLRNAHAISMLLLEKTKPVASTPELIKNIDELASLYAIRDMEQQERNTFNSLAQDGGLEFTFMYLKQQRADETTKALANEGSKLNHYKGYVPSVKSSGMSLIVADDTQSARLKAMSYERVGDYNGAGAEGTNVRKGYYFSNAPTRGSFNQGIVQNVNQTANGVSTTHGFTQGLTAGVVTDPIYVTKLVARMQAGAEKGTKEHMMPVFYADGTVRGFERSVDPVQVERLQSNDKLNQMLGVWQGRQVEEAMAEQVNNKLVDNLVQMHQTDLKAGKANEYVNIFDPKDKVLIDALKLMPAAVKDYMISQTGDRDEFWVRRDMVFDAFGYRAASVGDAWTGNSRWSDETQKTFQRIALGVMGNKAFRVLTNAEKFIQGYAADARTTIVVKSVIVPVMNLVSNVAQLAIRGVPLKDIARKAPAKAAEIEAYVKNRIRQVDAEAELRAAKTNNEKIKLEAEIQSLKDTQRRLSIWPLIEAGEFTAISDVGLTHDDVDLSQGRWHEFIEKKVDKLPEAIRNAGRYAYITKDTALFQGLQKAVQYGDFLGKAILFEDLTERKKLSPKEAMAMVTEEFINYDRLPGRFRGYLEQMGLLWFYNFKLRSTKVAANMLRNNPVHALLSSFIPMPSMLGEIGSPIGDNVLVKGIEGTLGYSMGPGMGLSAPTLNPWWQMVN